MMRHYPDQSSASDWLKQISQTARPIRSTTLIWVVTRHQYGISALVSRTTFQREASGGIAKCRLFSQAPGESGEGCSLSPSLPFSSPHLPMLSSFFFIPQNPSSQVSTVPPSFQLQPAI